MIKDRYLKIFLIPLLGFLIPIFGHLINYNTISPAQAVISNFFFIATSFTIFEGSLKIISHVRKYKILKQYILFKLSVLCVLAALYSFITIEISSFIWQYSLYGTLIFKAAFNTGIICTGCVIFLTVVYETIFLHKERELDDKVLLLLDEELNQAQINALKKRLDPHFLFNSLFSLSGLVKENPVKSQQFIQKLSEIYKYFLVNQDRDLISLENELQFVNDYYYLWKIRYENMITLETNIRLNTSEILLPPFSLQILLENAVKHNQFSQLHPLMIKISIQKNHLVISNNLNPKVSREESTSMGLKNLNAQFKFYFKENIIITRNQFFTVRMPLIKKGNIFNRIPNVTVNGQYSPQILAR